MTVPSPFAHIALNEPFLTVRKCAYIRVADSAMMLGDGINWLGNYLDKELPVYIFNKKRYFKAEDFNTAAMELLLEE